MRTITTTGLLLCLLALSACGYLPKIEPWVKPYERANIADPLMSLSRDPSYDSYLTHVYQSREGARGAESGGGGGCGCN